MLQITTGKLFKRATSRENLLRGVLFTNLYLEYESGQMIESPLFGRILQTSELASSPRTLIYEFTERIEASQSGQDFLISHGANSYLQDMATVVSFTCNCTCSPDIDLVRRLTNGQRGIATGQAPSKFVRRVFEKEVFSQPGDSAEFVQFVNHLLGLHRKTYLGVMRAIRTYVTGLHRIADDLELAYTLLVAAGESLTQDFDGHIPDWESVAEQKRHAIDQALNGAPEDVSQRVRDAILSFEHTALARRFQAFVAANVAPQYFQAQFEKDSYPVGRSDFPEVLAAAYQARSQYVHQLRQLPDMVTLGHSYVETIVNDRRRMLTLQGLSRLIRHVIMTFAQRQPTIEKEDHDYSLELAGVAQVQLSPSFWIARTDGNISEEGRNKLEGFLTELVSVVMRLPSAAITDISDVLKKFVVLAPNMNLNKRRPYLALLVMFNAIAGQKAIPKPASLEVFIKKDFATPCVEALVAFAFLGMVPHWSIEEQCSTFQYYKKQRGYKNGLRFPRVFEAAVALDLAERYRSAGLFDYCKRIVAEAADDYPDHIELRKLVEVIAEDVPLCWQEVLLHKPEAKDNEHSSGDGSGVASPTSNPPARKIKRRVRTPKPIGNF